MSSWTSAFVRCLRADVLKLRRTPALALAVLLPTLPPLLFFVFALQRGNEGTPEGISPVVWTIQNVLTLWAIFLIPPLAAVETSLLAGIEHHHGGWKNLLARPVPRSAAFAAKYVAAMGLMAIATVAACCYTVLSVWGLQRLRADAGFTGSLRMRETLVLFLLVGLASLFLLSVHAFVAMRWSSFALNVGLALAGLLGNAVLVESRARLLYPWAIPPAIENVAAPIVLGFGGRGTPFRLTVETSLAVFAAALVGVLGVWLLSRRDVA